MKDKRMVAFPVRLESYDEIFSHWLRRVKTEYPDFTIRWSSIVPDPVRYIAILVSEKGTHDILIYSMI